MLRESSTSSCVELSGCCWQAVLPGRVQKTPKPVLAQKQRACNRILLMLFNYIHFQCTLYSIGEMILSTFIRRDLSFGNGSLSFAPLGCWKASSCLFEDACSPCSIMCEVESNIGINISIVIVIIIILIQNSIDINMNIKSNMNVNMY